VIWYMLQCLQNFYTPDGGRCRSHVTGEMPL